MSLFLSNTWSRVEMIITQHHMTGQLGTNNVSTTHCCFLRNSTPLTFGASFSWTFLDEVEQIPTWQP